MHPAASSSSHAFHQSPILARPQCPVPFAPAAGGITARDEAQALGGGVPACGLQATAWDLAQFEPVKPTSTLQRLSSWLTGAGTAGDEGIQASAGLRGQGLLSPVKAQARADRLLTQGRQARDVLRHYAQARAHARLPGDAAWVGLLAEGHLPILLAGRHEIARLVFEATGEAAAAPVAVLPGGTGVLVEPHAFFQQQGGLPSARALRALQATFIHPRCSELLTLTAQLVRIPRSRIAEGMDLLVMGRAGADSLRHLKAALAGLLHGDEAAVVRALLHPQVRPVLAHSPLLDARLFDPEVVPGQPTPQAAAHALETLVVDALAHVEPHQARSRALLGVLGRRARTTLADAFVRADMASLQRVLAAYSIVTLNDVVRAWLRPVCGDLDALGDLGVKVRWHDRSETLRAAVDSDALPAGILSGDDRLQVAMFGQYDRPTRLAGASAAVHLAMGLAPEEPLPAGRGTLSRVQAEAAPGRPPLVMHVLPGGSPLAPLQPSMLLAEVIAAYTDGYAMGASQGFARALGMDKTIEGPNVVIEYLAAYIGQRLAGQPLFRSAAAGATATRRVIEARAHLDGGCFEQAERDVLGLVFGWRSFGTADDFRNLKRLTLSLHEQRKLDLLWDKPAAAGPGTPLHVVGGTLTTGTWLRPLGRMEDTYRMEPVTALPAARLPGTFALGDGTLLVDPEHIVSVNLPPSVPVAQRRSAGGSGPAT